MTHWHSAFLLPCEIYHRQLEHLWAGRVIYQPWFMWLEREWTHWEAAKLQFHSAFCWACLIKSEPANQALSCALCVWEGRELVLWEWSSSGKMQRLAHPCVKHIARITWQCCLPVKPLLMSAVLALLEEAWQDDGKNHTSLLGESSSRPLAISSSTSTVGWCCSPGLEHQLTLVLIMVLLPGK